MNQTNLLQRLWKTGLAAFVAVLLTACGPLEPTGPTTSPTTGGAIKGDSAGTNAGRLSNILRPGELVKVDFSGTSSPPDKHEENIKDDGTITLYLIGPVKAAGKTPGQLQAEIQQLYVPRFYKNLNVTLTTSDRFFIVGGQVVRPDRHIYLGPISVLGAIKASGDFTDFAHKRKVKLIRADGTTHTIDASKAQNDPSLDLPVYPGDTINVPGRIL